MSANDKIRQEDALYEVLDEAKDRARRDGFALAREVVAGIVIALHDAGESERADWLRDTVWCRLLEGLPPASQLGRISQTEQDPVGPAGSAHGVPDWRADPDEVTDPCLTCEGAGCQRCNGTGNEPKPVVQEHRVELTYDQLMLSHTAHCSCGWVGQAEKSMRSAWGHAAGHEHER